MSLIKCPECNKEISDKAKSCPNCGCPININAKYQIIITGYHDTDISACAGLTQTFNTNYEYEEAMNIFNNCPYIIAECDTVEESNLISRKLMKWGIDVQIMNPDGSIEFIDTDIVSCPKCGNTHIQVVPRKWSIFSGIFTNKVDRVCLKCKYKF
jgi:hypothetical protein